MPSQFLYEASLVPKDEHYRALVLKDMDKED
jgi:DNA helicase-2/ATP-dependent DNA helicase PcrA